MYHGKKDQCGRCGNLISVNNLARHQMSCGTKPEREKIGRRGGWNKGKTAATDTRVASNGKKISQALTGRTLTESHKKSLSKAGIDAGYGGYRPGGGRGKKGWFNGIWCDSSWELAFVMFHIDNGIPIARCTEVRSYEYEGKPRSYHPDFVANGKIVEIKGYNSSQWQAKSLSNPDITVLMFEDMKPYLDYAMSKYGKDFVKMYTESCRSG